MSPPRSPRGLPFPLPLYRAAPGPALTPSLEPAEPTLMQLGALIPLTDIGPDPSVVRDYAQTMEGLGYDFIEAPDHVLGVNTASRPDWEPGRNTSSDLFHDPFVLFGFLSACTTRLGFATGVLILPQRQTALIAKQAACLDVLCGSRFRLGIGVGWNEAEFTALNENFHNRGRRSEEQIEVMRRLWAEPHVTFEGRYHRIEDAGIKPRPASGRIPIWFGGHHERTLPRIAKLGDGWMPNAHAPDRAVLEIFDHLRTLIRQAGRDPAAVGIEVWTSCGAGTPADWRKEVAFWKQAGASHICLTTTFGRRHHTRIQGRTAAEHLEALGRYRDAVADAL
jgi:probable F420-dependent oxidoreductase